MLKSFLSVSLPKYFVFMISGAQLRLFIFFAFKILNKHVGRHEILGAQSVTQWQHGRLSCFICNIDVQYIAEALRATAGYLSVSLITNNIVLASFHYNPPLK